MAEKYGDRRQRAHNLPGRERWMTEDERSAALAIAKLLCRVREKVRNS